METQNSSYISHYINADHISKRINGVRALNETSFAISKGELFGFIGPDGAGKTTLFRILTTLLLPETGTISLGKYDIVRDFRKVRNIVGYMPGTFSLYSDLSVAENLEFFATIFGTTISENYHLIKDIYSHIEPFKYRKAGNLSGGMKQKLGLSCALIHRPELLVLDEPTTGIDAVSRKEFWDMLKKLKEQNITIIVSTPYMDEAQLCDRVALIQKGNVMQIDTPEAIIQNFDKPLYAVRSQNIYRLIRDLRNWEYSYSAFPYGQYVHMTSNAGEIPISGLQNYLEDKGHEKIDIERITPNIEDCFLDLMLKQ